MDASPTVYTVERKDLKVVNLCNPDMLRHVMQGFLPVLLEERRHVAEAQGPWHVFGALDNSIAAIRKGISGGLKSATASYGRLFARYLEGMGYDALRITEGGEGDICRHSTYLVFQPANVAITAENQVR